MLRELSRSIVSVVLLTIVLCGAYPLVVWAIGQAAFHDRAQGSLVRVDGRVVGSSLIAQAFTGPRYFHPRPSAAGYAADASAGSNLGPNSADLARAVGRRLRVTATLEGVAPAAVPVDLVTTSGSGLDPDISRAAALVQVARVARTRGLDPARVRQLVMTRVNSPTMGLLGTTRVNVLDLNLALDALR
ncbi:MAG: potassium-transporting ATPase subunit KdpC [Thermoleophilia bacterium]